MPAAEKLKKSENRKQRRAGAAKGGIKNNPNGSGAL